MVSKNKVIKQVTLDDFVGFDYIKDEIQQIVNILSNPKHYTDFGIEIPKGLVLSGRPGVGKTLITRIISSMTNLPTYNVSASEEKSSANKVCRQISRLFKKAAKNAPSIIVLDELDRMIPSEDFSSDKARSILSTLLTNLDGFCGDHSGVFVIATTNGWDCIDEALRRSGRLDRRISIPLPPTDSRKMILKYYFDKAQHMKYDESLIEQLAVKTVNFSCADIKKLVNDGLYDCLAKNSHQFMLGNFIESLMKIRVNDVPQSLGEAEKSATAYHELGHCIVNYANKGILPDILIRRFDNAEGANLLDADDADSKFAIVTQDNLPIMVQSYLGGMAAEELFVGDIGTGASNDIQNVRSLWHYMYSNGMLGLSKIFPRNRLYLTATYMVEETDASNEMVNQMTDEFRAFVEEQYKKAIQILKNNVDLVEYLHQVLIVKEFLPKEEIASLIAQYEREHPKLTVNSSNISTMSEQYFSDGRLK